MALYDRDVGSPMHNITAPEAKKCATSSDHSEGVGVDSVTEHHFSAAIAPPDEFTNVITVSGDRPRGRQSWRTSVGMADQPERRPPGYHYDNPVCFVKLRAANSRGARCAS